MSDSNVTERRGTVNDLDFVWLEAGDPSAPLALCLHGFPDTARGWRRLLPDLAAAGLHAVAPFARGYAPTAVPPGGLSPIGAWIADACAFHELLGNDTPGILVGHDWGALATYGAASFAPERWSRLVAASIPPSSVMAARLFDYDQIKMFWYQYVFLQPTAEMIVSHDDLAFIGRLWGDWSPGYDATDELPAVRDALRGPDNLTAALSTYRTTLDLSQLPPEYVPQAMAMLSPHTQPTLYLHGTNDTCVPIDVAPLVAGALPVGSKIEVVENAGHFLQYEQPELVNRHIVDWAAA